MREVSKGNFRARYQELGACQPNAIDPLGAVELHKWINGIGENSPLRISRGRVRNPVQILQPIHDFVMLGPIFCASRHRRANRTICICIYGVLTVACWPFQKVHRSTRTCCDANSQ